MLLELRIWSAREVVHTEVMKIPGCVLVGHCVGLAEVLFLSTLPTENLVLLDLRIWSAKEEVYTEVMKVPRGVVLGHYVGFAGLRSYPRCQLKSFSLLEM